MKRLLLALTLALALAATRAEAVCTVGTCGGGVGVPVPLSTGNGGTGNDNSATTGVQIYDAGTPSTPAGTTTTVLHGNAAGAASFGAVDQTTDITGATPIANGGTANTTAAAAFKALGSIACHNASGVSLTAGQLVYASAENETAPALTVTLADADAGNKPAKAIVTATITDGADGTCYFAWRSAANLNTNAATQGDPVYLSTTAGGWTLTPPTGATSIQQVVGFVAIKSATVGVIEFNIPAGATNKIGNKELQDSSVLPANLDVTADNTTADATNGHHGLLPKLSGTATDFLNGSGSWAAPTGDGRFIGYTLIPISVDTVLTESDCGGFVVGVAANKVATLPTSPSGPCKFIVTHASSGVLTVRRGGSNTVSPHNGGTPADYVTSGGTQVELYYSSGGWTMTGFLPGVSAYGSSDTYGGGQKVALTTPTRVYVSVAGDNYGNDPSTDDGTHWQLINGAMVSDEADAATQAIQIKFAGAGVTEVTASGVSTVTIPGGGGWTPSQFLSSLTYDGVNTTSGTWAAVPITGETTDTDAYHASTNTYVTIPTTANYLITASVWWPAGTTLTRRSIGFYLNDSGHTCATGAGGSIFEPQNDVIAPDANGFEQQYQTVAALTSAATLDLCVKQASGGGINSVYPISFSVVKLGS